MAIYTKFGDKGQTRLYSKDPNNFRVVGKNSPVISAIGAVDELNAYIGICITVAKDKGIERELVRIQNNLFIIGSILAGSNYTLEVSEILNLERQMDKIEGSLPVLKNFILPGGDLFASHLMYARALTRHAERKVISYKKITAVNIYINRLSDYLFMLGRKVNNQKGIKEQIWQSRVK